MCLIVIVGEPTPEIVLATMYLYNNDNLRAIISETDNFPFTDVYNINEERNYAFLGDLYGDLYACNTLILLGTDLDDGFSQTLVDLAYENGSYIIYVGERLSFEGPRLKTIRGTKQFCNKILNGEKLW